MADDVTQQNAFQVADAAAGQAVIDKTLQEKQELARLREEAKQALDDAIGAESMLIASGADAETLARAAAAVAEARSVYSASRAAGASSADLRSRVSAVVTSVNAVAATVIVNALPSPERQMELHEVVELERARYELIERLMDGINERNFADFLRLSTDDVLPEIVVTHIRERVEDSPTAKESIAAVNAQSPSERKAAMTRREENRKLIQDMHKDPRYAEYHDILGEMEKHRVYGGGVRDIVRWMKAHPDASPEEVGRVIQQVHDKIEGSLALTRMVGQELMQRIPGFAEALERYGQPLDAHRLAEDYHKLSPAQRERIIEIATRMSAPDADIRKLSPEDQHLYALSIVMNVSDVSKGAKALTELAQEIANNRNVSKEAAAQYERLFDASLSVEERAENLFKIVKQRSGGGDDSAAIRNGARQLVQLIDKNPEQARQQLEGNDYKTSQIIADFRHVMEVAYLGVSEDGKASANVYNAMSRQYANSRLTIHTLSQTDTERAREIAQLNAIVSQASASLENAMSAGAGAMLSGSVEGAKIAATAAAAQVEDATGGVVSKDVAEAVLSGAGVVAATGVKKAESAGAIASLDGAAAALSRNLGFNTFFGQELARREFDAEQTIRTLQAAGVIADAERSDAWSVASVAALDGNKDGRLSKEEIDAALKKVQQGPYTAVEQSFIAQAKDKARDAMELATSFGRALNEQLDAMNKDRALLIAGDTDRDGKLELFEAVAQLQQAGITDLQALTKDGKPLTVEDIRAVLVGKQPAKESGTLIS